MFGPQSIMLSLTQDHVLLIIQSQFSAINLSFISVEPTANPVIDDVMRQLSFDEIKLDGEADFGDVTEVLVFEVPMSEVPNDHVVNESDTHIDVELAVDVGRPEEHVIEHVRVDKVVDDNGEEAVVHGSGEEAIEQGNSEEAVKQGSEEVVEETSGEQVDYDVDGIDNAYETQYYVETSKNAGTDDDEDDDFLVMKKMKYLVPDGVLEGDDIDVVNADGFDSDACYDDETSTYMRRRLNELRKDMEEALNASGCWKHSFYTRQKFSSSKEAKDRVYLHSNESKRKLKLYKNKNTRVRARCEGELRVFTMSQGSGPTHPSQAMSDGPSGSSDPTIRSKKGRV
ncbi:hypothetical protein Tco_0087353 [Tanacetum coccineum]